MSHWDYQSKDGLQIITIPEWLQSDINIAFTCRRGGVSQGIYESLNLGLHVGDKDELVIENRRRLLRQFDASLDQAVCCQQIHGNQVLRVLEDDRGRGSQRLDDVLTDADAMVTDVPGIYLLNFYADCVPVYFWDSEHRSIGSAHCGWKGTMGRIAVNTLQAMHVSFGTDIAKVQIFIGPSIGPCCYHIQPDLATQVKNQFGEMTGIITVDQDSGYYWDLQGTNQQQLQQCGVPLENIVVCRLCTSCRTDLFYSYRQEHGVTGRMGALIGIK